MHFLSLRKLAVLGLLLPVFVLQACASLSPPERSAEEMARATVLTTEAIVGVYRMTGTNRDQTTYEGTLVIDDLGRQHVQLQWRDSDSVYTGQGAMFGGSLHGFFGERSADCIVRFFEVLEDGSLDGFWFYSDDVVKRGSERATLMSPRPETGLAGIYSVSGEDPDGKPFEGTMRVTALQEDYFKFQWEGEERGMEGIGELGGGEVVVLRSDAGQCGRIEYEVLDKGRTLKGTWVLSDESYETKGHEIAVRTSDPMKGTSEPEAPGL